jgi:hypothetical protein
MPVEVDGPEHVFSDRDLIYSARHRCSCGAGMAYVPQVTWAWDCADVQAGRAVPAGVPGAQVHMDPIPLVFAGRRIPSESPSETTRPAGPPARRLIIPLH